jgi:AmiR/NasT family two-component response regulator
MSRFRLKHLREIAVVVVHPPDEDGQMILDQLGRIGCRNALSWPPPDTLPTEFDVAFIGLFFDHQDEIKTMLKRSPKPGPTIIGVVNYENPAMLQLLLDVNAAAATSKPVKSFGVLTNLVVARALWQQQLIDKAHIEKLEQKIKGHKIIAKAKSILMEMHNLNEQDAHKVLREQAMQKRISIDEMAHAVINASELLSIKRSDV